MDAEERRNRREERKRKQSKNEEDNAENTPTVGKETVNDNRMAQLLMRNEDELLNFVAKINKAYQEKLGRPAPFMTFVICGMQSAGKATECGNETQSIMTETKIIHFCIVIILIIIIITISRKRW